MKIGELTDDDISNGKSRTFVFYDEGHTLGNALRLVIASYPEVTFCGYTVPHPAESKMHLRIQTNPSDPNGPKAIDILQRGLSDLEKMCDLTLERFDEAMQEFRSRTTADSDVPM